MLASALLQSILIISLSCFSLRSRSAPSPLLSYLFHDLLLCSPAPFERPLFLFSLHAYYRLPMCLVHVAFMRSHIYFSVASSLCFASHILCLLFLSLLSFFFLPLSLHVYCLTLPSVSCDVIGANIGPAFSSVGDSRVTLGAVVPTSVGFTCYDPNQRPQHQRALLAITHADPYLQKCLNSVPIRTFAKLWALGKVR